MLGRTDVGRFASGVGVLPAAGGCLLYAAGDLSSVPEPSVLSPCFLCEKRRAVVFSQLPLIVLISLLGVCVCVVRGQ